MSVNRCLNRAYVNCHIKLNWKSKANKCYISDDFLEAKTLSENGCPWLGEGIDYNALSLIWYQALVIPCSYYLVKDDHIHSNCVDSILPVVLPAGDGIPTPPIIPHEEQNAFGDIPTFQEKRN